MPGNRPPHDQQLADGQALLATIPGLRSCLSALPHFCFSPTGTANLKRRFYLTDQGLEVALLAFEATFSHRQAPLTSC